MFAVEVYASVRRFVFDDGSSRREAARVFGLSRETVSKMCRFSLPPGYTRVKPIAKPKLGPRVPVIDAILAADMTAPVKQRHTTKRIFECLRDEHGYGGGYFPPVLGARSRSNGKIPEEPFEAGQLVVVQPNVVTLDGRAGVQTGEMLLITEDGVLRMHKAPRGFRTV